MHRPDLTPASASTTDRADSIEPDTLARTAKNHAILDRFLRESCNELMEHYGLHTSIQVGVSASHPPTAVAIAASDFSGPDLSGTIGLRVTASVVMETYRAAVGEVIQARSLEAADWTRELVNQLVGRLKNKLRAYQVSFEVSCPRLLPALPAREFDRALRRRFVCDEGKFAGYLDVLIAPEVVLAASATEASLPDEGDVVLF